MTTAGYQTLVRAVRVRPFLKYLGHVLLSLVGMALIPGLFAAAQAEFAAAARLLVVAAVFALVGWRLGRLRAPEDIQANEALVITAAAFFIGALLMTWPLMGADVAFVDALFESVSAITTTGLSTISASEPLTTIHLFTRAWMQWYGGMVIIVLAVALMLPPGAVNKQMAQSDTLGEGIVGSARNRARTLLAAYIVMTVAGIGLLLALGTPVFDAVAHVLAAISTGGFATHSESLAAFDSELVRWVIIGLSLLGALSFSLYNRVWHRGWREFAGDTGCRTLFAGVAVTALALGATMAASGADGSVALRHAPLLAASAHATAGFSSLSVSDLDPASTLVLMGAMFIGGDAGSSAGGIKIARWLLILQLVKLTFARTALPDRTVARVRLYGQPVDEIQTQRAVSIVVLFLLVILASWLAFLAFGYPPLASLFDVVSATATTGLSAGVTSSTLPLALKLVLCADMLVGRLEILAVLLVLYPTTWFGRRID